MKKTKSNRKKGKQYKSVIILLLKAIVDIPRNFFKGFKKGFLGVMRKK